MSNEDIDRQVTEHLTVIPPILRSLPVYFHGTDDTTPAGCEIFTTTVLDQLTTYILRNGQIIGRIEHTQDMAGYAGTALKGGSWVGSGEFTQLAQTIADRTDENGA